jgi:hypothetical protein
MPHQAVAQALRAAMDELVRAGDRVDVEKTVWT